MYRQFFYCPYNAPVYEAVIRLDRIQPVIPLYAGWTPTDIALSGETLGVLMGTLREYFGAPPDEDLQALRDIVQKPCRTRRRSHRIKQRALGDRNVLALKLVGSCLPCAEANAGSFFSKEQKGDANLFCYDFQLLAAKEIQANGRNLTETPYQSIFQRRKIIAPAR
jgi:hypothetical protein